MFVSTSSTNYLLLRPITIKQQYGPETAVPNVSLTVIPNSPCLYR